MKYIQAQFSLKYEPQVRIRRAANEIEDYLRQQYNPPQTMPIPDEFAPEAPRIIMYSYNGHSQINFSQISADFTVRFDNDFLTDFEKTKEYIQQRVVLIVELLKRINIKDYLFCGVSYNTHLEIDSESPIDYLRGFLHREIPNGELYEASQNIAVVRKDKYFINQQIGTYKEYKGTQGAIPNLLEIGDMIPVSEGVSLTLDINNRYQYLFHKRINPIDNSIDEVKTIYSLISENLEGWK